MLSNLDLMRKRLEFQGGIRQEDRIIKDKYNSFLKALEYSYQSCDVMLMQHFNDCLYENKDEINPDLLVHKLNRALINPDNIKQDYDNKILSVDYKTEYQSGDVIQWIGTQTYWLIYLQALTEDAYFRSEIRRCRYKIKFKDKEGKIVYTWAAIRGPVETKIETIQKNQIRLDRPNLSLNILMPLNEKTRKAFDRYSRFLFNGKCWQVQATDSISMQNVLEINAEEYYIDKEKDDQENEIINGLEIEEIKPEITKDDIQGNGFIKPMIAEKFSTQEPGNWSVNKGAPVCINGNGTSEIELIWNKSTSGQFTLYWSNGKEGEEEILKKRTIVVESLF